MNGNQTLVAAVDPVAAQKLFDFNAVAGSLADLGDDGIVVSKKSADSHHWQIGSSVPVTFVKTGTQPMRVAMIYKDALAIPGAYVIPLSAYERNFSEQLDYQIYAKLQDNASYKADQEAQVNGIVTLVYVLLFLSIVIALIGIIITLLLSIHERTRELGLLRAVGMTRRQVRWTVTLESVIITLVGTFVGLVIGLFFGFSVVTALRDQGITSFAAAPGSLIVVVVIAIGLGIIAALYPARRAAKLDVLQAISTE